jgi:hypothetical protein
MDFQLKPLGKTCAATGQPLVPGSVCHSVVVERNGQFLRLDYSDAAWRGPPADAVGYWRTRVPLASSVQRLDPDALMRYFEQLCEDASPSQDTNRYVAALLLLKLKRLQLDDVRQDDDGEYLLLSGSRGEGVFEVRNLQLPDAELSRLQQALKSHLAAEWTP